MPRKLGSCNSCRRPIYDAEGPSDACGCDEGCLTTLFLREGGAGIPPHTPEPPRRAALRAPNRNGDQLPDLDPGMFLSAAGRAEMAGAQMVVTNHRVAYPPGSSVEVEDLDVGFEPITSGLDISFEQEEMDWPRDLPRPTTPSRDRFRVDRGAPVREPFAGRMASGPSGGQVVGRVGQRGQAMPRPPTAEEVRRDVQEWTQLEQAHNTHLASLRQEARVVRPVGSQPVVSRPVDRSKIPTALERLGRADFDDDPFK